MRTFDPSEGKLYCTEGFRGIRLLILGEAHRIRRGTENRNFTKDVVEQSRGRKSTRLNSSHSS